jgi:hypothetical protein
MRCLLIFLLLGSIWTSPIYGQVVSVAEKPLAFPGAEGFGKYTTGGRGGKVLKVTSLADEGPGTLRWAIEQEGARTVIFDLSGTIFLESPLDIKKGDLTLAGQTAPGDGITIANFPLVFEADNLIMRYLRFRMGDLRKVEGDAMGGKRSKDIIIDHCSISWGTDEAASFYYNRNFTLQWCIISESLNESVHSKGPHGYGGIWGGMGATFAYNLMAHHNSRMPRFSGSSTVPNPEDELVDYRYNVIYNWGGNNTYGGETGRYNVVNNYYKPGPATQERRKSRILNPSLPYGKFYVQGNILEGDEVVTTDNSQGVVWDKEPSDLETSPFEVVSLPVHNAEKALEWVLQKAGASHRRDAIDKRIIEETRNGTAQFGKEENGIIDSQTDVGGWPTLKSKKASKDSDGDGIPDAWEKKMRLNPKNASDGSAISLHPFYTNLEVYINSLVE